MLADPALADKVTYIGTTWAMLAQGSWNADAARQLTTFVGQIAVELRAAAVLEFVDDLQVLCGLLGTVVDQPLSLSPTYAACVTRAIAALAGRVMPVAAPSLAAASDQHGTGSRAGALPTPLLERSIGG